MAPRAICWSMKSVAFCISTIPTEKEQSDIDCVLTEQISAACSGTKLSDAVYTVSRWASAAEH